MLTDLFTEKQNKVLHTYLNEDFRMMILSGAVRSGKTFINNYLFLLELRRVAKQAELEGEKHPQYILAGASSGSIYNNVILSISNTFGVDLPPDRHNHFHLFGVDITPIYTDSIRGLAGARGFTSYGAYVNEASLANERVFEEINNRCSKPNSKIICDTNPDNPQHWLKVNHIDKDDPKARTIYFNFTIDDNPTLSADYVESLKASKPSGVFYDRDILGLWVSGDGIVYRDFDKRKMVKPTNELPLSFDKVIAGVDWGYEHACSITVWGLRGDDWWLLEEHTKQYKEIDYWTDVAHQIQKKYGQNIPFYADSARPEHCDHFKHAGINCQYGWKSVVPGIEEVAKLMKTGHFFIAKDAPVDFMDEIYNYHWDDKAEDKPIKEADHVMDSMRYALASYIHMQNQKKYYPKPDRKSILAGMRRFGL